MPKSKKLTRTGKFLEHHLMKKGWPVISHYEFFRLLQMMYREGKDLYLQHTTPTKKDHYRYIRALDKAGVVKYDRDYGDRIIRVIDIPEHSPDEVVCLADPLCYISHLSAMQVWGLTDRSSYALICTRPDRKNSVIKLSQMMSEHSDSLPPKQFRLFYIGHPEVVRGRQIRVYESKKSGTSVNLSDTAKRVATIGQTFLDMLQQPQLCGGMPHVLDVFDEYGEYWFNEIVSSVDSSDSSLVKSRAGYILEERLGIQHVKLEDWKNLVQRGGSRKLDPTKAYVPVHSETWCISLNV